MKPVTQQAIRAIDFSFYTSDAAADFSNTRSLPWPGWERVLSLFTSGDSELSVLDVGCGNGRLAGFLAERCNYPFTYLGVDMSEPLLEVAKSQDLDPSRFRFDSIDFLNPQFETYLTGQTFSLIALFGVMHHIPAFESRREFLAMLLRHLNADGRLVVTFWRFGEYQRFRRKLIPWPLYNKNAPQAIDLDDLEQGDFLMQWGERKGDVRYCHFSDQQEIDNLLRSINSGCAERFLSDGEDNRLNDYLVFHAKR
jgi:tRNA (uracil-5-)-methyltransferase TRM9